MRNRYLDLLRAAAIVRVIVYHLFGWPWLSIVLPAMGVMFALAGSLTAASLEKREATRVVTSRLRRLLPPLWLLGLVAVPVMLVAGWAQESDGEHPFSLPRLLFWLFPIGDPPGSDQAIDVWEPLWYIRAYVWFVLLSPVLFALWRRFGWAAVAVPPLMLAGLDLTGLELPGTADAALWDFVTYGACWIAGFAHHDGRLARLKPWVAYPVALTLAAAALWWARDQGSFDLNDISESQALWSLAFVLIVLRWQPPMGWLSRVGPLDRAVTLINARAVTVYLWHNIAIAAVWPVLAVLALDDLGDRLGPATDLLAALALTLLAVLVFGWAEDLAAKRRPRIWPPTAPPPKEAAAPEHNRTAPPHKEAAAPEHHRTAPPHKEAAAPVQAEPAPALSKSAPPRNTAAPHDEALSEHPEPESSILSTDTPHYRSSAAAAMIRTPRNWPPKPPQRHDPGLPVAGRPAEPLDEEQRPV